MNKRRSNWREGVVKRGDQIGRTLGFPTANLNADIVKDIAEDGVYSSFVVIDEDQYIGAIYIGPRILLGEKERVLEVNVLDFEGDLYGKSIRFTLHKFIRGPKNFPDKPSLVKQLQLDILDVRSSINSVI